ncbi:hypothetical protein Avbf_12981 [Armadillidium vulgare]|nr:hypothetical protein Avbf_12981 [Armadillidium vulgare]
MDIKIEIEIKEELLEESLEDVINNEPDSEWKEIQTKIFSPNIDMKEEIEIKDEEVNITEEHPEDGDQIEQKFVLQESQIVFKNDKSDYVVVCVAYFRFRDRNSDTHLRRHDRKRSTFSGEIAVTVSDLSRCSSIVGEGTSEKRILIAFDWAAYYKGPEPLLIIEKAVLHLGIKKKSRLKETSISPNHSQTPLRTGQNKDLDALFDEMVMYCCIAFPYLHNYGRVELTSTSPSFRKST